MPAFGIRSRSASDGSAPFWGTTPYSSLRASAAPATARVARRTSSPVAPRRIAPIDPLGSFPARARRSGPDLARAIIARAQTPGGDADASRRDDPEHDQGDRSAAAAP